MDYQFERHLVEYAIKINEIYQHHNEPTSCYPEGETKKPNLRVDFDRRLKLEFHGSRITSDAGLLAYRELDDALGLSERGWERSCQDGRTGKNGQHVMTGLFRQSVFGRLGGYEDVNDADRLGRDPAMRWIVGGRAVAKTGRFDQPDGTLRDRVPCQRRELRRTGRSVGGNGSTVCTPASAQGRSCSTWIPASARPTAIRKAPPTMGTLPAPAIIRCSCSTSSAIWNARTLVPATFTAPTDGAAFWSLSLSVTGNGTCAAISEGEAAFAEPDIYEFLEAEGYNYTIRLKANAILQQSIAHLLTRPVGRPPNMWSLPTPASAIRQGHGTRSVAWLPRWNGTQANWSPCRLHRHQPDPAGRAGGRLLQSARDGRAAHALAQAE